MSITTRNRTSASIIVDPSQASTKRIAWAFGCARKDSDEEMALYRILVERVAELRKGREP